MNAKKSSVIILLVIVIGVVVYWQQGEENPVLANYKIEGTTAEKQIAYLEEKSQKSDEFSASIRNDRIIYTEGDKEYEEAFSQDLFYVSFAPYIYKTHDCFYHSLTSCQGELVNEQIHILIVNEKDNVIFDDNVTTNANGFYGVWLEKDKSYTINIQKDEAVGAAVFETDEESPTCITTIKLQ
ncbi:CueP family metal-binding protein [Breznakia pachnodae]|uniref:Uncharacterized protein n=1 Tax=Breznakia pachnodae TaxID=265178 RepID=A0ABU0E0M9_9FIRM|nr:CueP family metal-binding protein [Breznakia pachnodae]MDQ0360452.1 hypothetical protein [Breznakia pachnodae]